MAWAAFFIVAAPLFARLVVAQASGWEANQVNTTMCQWDSPRAAVIRDTLYIDGGILWWMAGMADGTASPLSDGNPLGLVYQLNFSTPFNTSQNLSSVFTTAPKTVGNANNLAQLYYDGGMLANDYEWFTYGGLIESTSAFTPPGQDVVASYQIYDSLGPPKQFIPGYGLGHLPNGITRYVTNGAAVSVPSENLGFYFGGLRSANFGPIYYPPNGSDTTADIQSSSLIELDMSVQQNEVWTNRTLPPLVPERAGAELVWVPVSEKGILVALGGVVFPTYDTTGAIDNATATAQSKKQSPGFMTTVYIYDIAQDTWYEQPTNGTGPGQLTQGCTVLASAPDGSSHNIYWYGGYDGINPTGDYSDDVWVLSIPSFTWVKVHSGATAHGRAGHRCTKPYPDQMIVVGGYASSPQDFNCVGGGILQIFNLSSAEWMTSYDPSKWSNYTVPSAVSQAIGGSGAGGATLTAPKPDGFSNSSLATLFKSKYDASKIKTWYPYHASSTPPNNRTFLPQPVTKSGTPSYLAPVLGVVLGLIFVSLVVLAILLYRRRRILQVNGTATQSESGTLDNRRWVTNWLRATPVDVKAPPTVTSDETPMTPDAYEEDVSSEPSVPEMAGIPIVEMEDTSRPNELHDTGLVPLALGKKTANGRHPNGLGHSPSAGSRASHTSSVSRDSNVSGRPGISPVATPRADSPALGQVEPSRIGSELSGLSESDRGHLRGISETSVSTDGGTHAAAAEAPSTAAPAPTEAPAAAITGEGDLTPAPLSVISPLTPAQNAGEPRNYTEAGAADTAARAPESLDPPQAQTQNRRSNFSEKLDEVGEQ